MNIIDLTEDKKPIIKILLYCDGFDIVYEDQMFRYNHNDEDLGTQAIRELLEYLGFDVDLEESY